MIAFGIGTLIGSALPDSSAERRAARTAADRIDLASAKQRLSDHAREVQEGVQDKAREAAQDLKGSARDASADVKDEAQRESQRVRDDVQQSGQDVRGRT
jgi:gas vesicle protein